MSRRLSHVGRGGEARMVDVGEKEVTRREAVATARVSTTAEVIRLIRENALKKGDVLATARLAGVMAAKRTSELVPLCHPLSLEVVTVDAELERAAVLLRATVRTSGKTGVEMEALTAAAVAALTVYDMCKAVDRAMVIEAVRLEEKSGGASGQYRRAAAGPKKR